jgi:hypothetical protein
MKKYLFLILIIALGLILNAQVCLNPSVGSPFSLAQQPFAITSADFNGDGKADLATADRNVSTVSVFLGDGVATFTSTTSFTVGSFPNSITNADFNADGKIDMATTNSGSSNVSILLGDGAGNFTATTSISVGSAPSAITKGDFNMDSKVDLAIANNSSNTISILLGNGLGGFGAAVNFGAGTGPISVISADFNSDSKIDLGVANATSNNVSILLGNGAGSFSTAVNFSAGTFPRSIINGDFNADGKVDLATANDQSNNISVLIGDGTGNFAPSLLYTVGTNPNAVTSADFNSDGKADLASANVNSNNISVLLGNGAGTFSSAVNIGVGSAVTSVISVDFNSDGRDDIISANFSSLSIFLNQTPVVTANSTATSVCAGTNATLTGGGAVTYTWTGGVSDGVAFTPTSTTLYTVTGTDGNGCTNTAVKTIIVNPVPTATAGLDQSLTCASPTVTLNGTSVPSSCTPVWTGGVASGSNSFNATASSAGDYTLTVTNPANGCSATDVVQVTANASIPTITISVSNTLTCANTTATISASSSAALPNYLWSGPSVVSGGTTANAIVDQPGNYTITVTDIPTGCSATSNINVTQDITLPSVTIISSPSVICSGNSSTLTANGAVTYTWSTTQNTTSISVSPGTTSSYTVSGTGTNGCVNSAIETITVNATPTLAITGNTNICNGSTSTLTGSGATSYTWDSGANTTTISVTPTITTTYTLTGDNGNGCSNSLPVTVSIIPNKAITGIITSTAGATGGDIIIYKYTANLSQWDSLTITPIGGTYTFNNIDSGLYVLRAMPTATNIQVTYAPNSISWQGATVINHGCTNNTTQNIDLIGLAPIALGTGVITGTITEASGFGARMSNESKPMIPGTPIGGIIVKGGKNPGGQMFVQTITDGSGTYTLTGLPLTGTDDYFIFVDIPGLDTNLTYHYVLTASNNQINGLNFTVDSIYINPVVNYVTGISNDQSVLENKITLFPNPANQKFTLEYELIKSANVLIELFDVVGHKVKTISSNSFEEKDKHSHSVNIEDLSAGVYFVKLKINDSETTIKLIIN